MKAGIIGYPLTGKRTLFNLISGSDIKTGVFTEIETEKRIVKVPDDRILKLNDIFKPKKLVHAEIELILVPHLGTDPEKNKKIFLNLKELDILIHIVRNFQNDDIFHVNDTVDPERDINVINEDIILADMPSKT